MKLVVNNGQKPGRNDPCFCGSGLKYKKCCANKNAEPPMPPEDFPRRLDPATMRREMEAMMGQMTKIIQEKGLSIEEANSYFTGRNMDDIAHEAGTLARTPQEKAEELALEAYSARSSKQAVLMAKQALDMDPNCAQAYLALEQEISEDPIQSIKYFALAIDAAEKTLGKKFIEENVGHFWLMHETRTYMRAQQYLAQAYWDVKRQSDAIKICWNLLKLNPNDNQGIRYILFDFLLTDNRLEEVEQLLGKFPDETFAHWEYNKALYFYKKFGPESEKAKTQILHAEAGNPYVAKYLVGKLKIPSSGAPDSYSPGSKEEALCYVQSSLMPWLNTEGAMEWLKALKLGEAKAKKKPSKLQ